MLACEGLCTQIVIREILKVSPLACQRLSTQILICVVCIACRQKILSVSAWLKVRVAFILLPLLLCLQLRLVCLQLLVDIVFSVRRQRQVLRQYGGLFCDSCQHNAGE